MHQSETFDVLWWFNAIVFVFVETQAVVQAILIYLIPHFTENSLKFRYLRQCHITYQYQCMSE